MAKSKRKNSLSLYIKKLNEIDINTLIASLKNIKLDDLKKVDINDLTLKIKKSQFFKPSIGLLGASLFFIFLLIPSLEKLIFSFNTSRKYQEQSNSLASQRIKIKKLDSKIKKANLFISEINESIISKNEIIYVSKLINTTALKSNVNILSILPVDSARSGSLCRDSSNSRNSRNSKKIKTKKGSFQENFYEINLESNYLDLIKFLNNIQLYDVVILPSCLEVFIVEDGQYNQSNAADNVKNNSSKIIPLSESGLPFTSTNTENKLDSDNSSNRVKIRLVFKIPSHSK